MKIERFSPKQLKVMCWWCERSQFKNMSAIICDGAVRSGKTICMGLSFVLWAFYRFDGMDFAICGKTIRNVKRNIIAHVVPILRELGFLCELKVSENLLTVSGSGKTNRFYFYGGKDEASASLIQGMTLAGVLLDEVALMPRSFVEQALARCSVTGAKFWFNCNPEHPYHWFYTEWISKLKERNALYVHFTMNDNPSLSKETKARYENLFSGAFYQRFVLGKWVKAEGLVYPFMKDEMFVDAPRATFDEWVISVDYGTVNPTSAGLWGRRGETWYRVDEYYYSSRETGCQRTDEEHYEAIKKLSAGRKLSCVVVDPSAASLITLMKRDGSFAVIPADNNVLNGIRMVSSALKTGKIKICRCCNSAIKEFALYSWNDDISRDVPVKENDHAMDEIRYFVSTVAENNGSESFFIALPREDSYSEKR